MVDINVNYKQWATQKKKSIAYQTLEIYHSSVGVLRYVTNQQFNKSFILGSSEPRNSNELVEFQAFGFQVQKPSQNNEPILKLDIQLGRVGTDLKKKLKNIKTATQLMEKAEVIFRIFINGEQVQRLPFEIATITLKDRDAVIRAEQSNPTFRDISRRYESNDFPGLAQTL